MVPVADPGFSRRGDGDGGGYLCKISIKYCMKMKETGPRGGAPTPWIHQWVQKQRQWRIQDFPEEGAPTPHGGANIRFCQIFLHEIERIWAPLDPPLKEIFNLPLTFV